MILSGNHYVKNIVLTILIFVVGILFCSCSDPGLVEKNRKYVSGEINRIKDSSFTVTYQTLINLLANSEKIKDYESQKKILNIIIARLRIIDSYDLARKYGCEFYRVAEKTRDTANMFSALRQLSLTCQAENDLEKAIAYAGHALDLLKTAAYFKITDDKDNRNFNNETHLKFMLRFIAKIYHKQGNFDSAIHYISLARKNSYHGNSLIQHYKALSYLYESTGDSEKEILALDSLVRTIDSAGRAYNKNFVPSLNSAEYYVRLAKLYLGKGDMLKALDYLNVIDRITIPEVLFRFENLTYLNVFRYYSDGYRLKDSILNLSGDKEALAENYKKIAEVNELIARLYKKQEILNRRIFVNKLNFRNYLEQEREHERSVFLIGFCVFIVLSVMVFWVSSYINKKSVRKKNSIIARLSDTYIPSGENTGGYGNTLAEEDGLKKLFGLMEKIMTEKRPYLDSSLGINDMAGLVDTNAAYVHLSVKENTVFNGFTEYVDRYRVNYACSLMKKNGEYSVGNIAVRSGFISKRACRKAFLRYISMTPKEYKRTLRR